MEKKTLYRVLFSNTGKVYDVYARQVTQGGLYGFIEVEDLVFGEKSALLVDPAEEALRREFEFTKRLHLPLNCVIRIEEVDKSSAARGKIVALPEKNSVPDSPLFPPPA